ncbi:MAG: NADH-quinone oxidoreductase subunit J [Marinobacter sp.]|uniref:complex I subunit 5 family protein n=1 Tax=Marinobacter sp. TaxID=50741 RepID=UPI0029C2C38E|nr:proton-conducting transporter membrane subunit [Marinobacter sp.]MDX5329168.1 NADH-quinone oxidoreductase subunit J [Marinobacter sp.]MDX5335890.1 NADH-quinone oxidoreductase subunit J [Marinobacter sp.]MDX5386916.1 NADH-quinone oxidoreductase subunit J [Marinobacter sp.]MDX5472300.1 NADH-quinone oxidoreductase subunit J [Marinobacter sp.]
MTLWLMAGLLFTPLAWAVLTLLLDFSKGRVVTWLGILVQVLVSLGLWAAVASDGGFLYLLGGWQAPLGIELRVDGLAVTFVLLTALVAAACGWHASIYLDPGKPWHRYFWPLFWFLWAGLNAVWLGGDLFNLYVGLELISLAAVGLVALGGQADALRAAIRYLMAALLGSLAYLLGVALIYGQFGTLSLAGVTELMNSGDVQSRLTFPLILMLLGLALKTALFPMHGWLPPAHGIAKSPVSALLSALVVKASFYIAARLWLDLGGDLGGYALAQLIGVLGSLAVIWGSWLAFRQAKLKQVVAYSSVAQIGYLFLLFPLTWGVTDAISQQAQQGITLQVVSHALAKAAMFLAAGNLIMSVGSNRVDALAGVSRFLPFSLFSFGLAGVSLMGLPPTGGFAAKWLLLQASLASGQWWWLGVLLAGGLLSAAYVFRVYRASFIEATDTDQFYHPSRSLEVIPMILALLSLGLGLVAEPVLSVMSLPFEGGSR